MSAKASDLNKQNDCKDYSKAGRLRLTRSQRYLWSFTLIMLPLCLALGHWQWQKAAKKEAMLQDAQRQTTVVALGGLSQTDRLQLADFQPVRLHGWYHAKEVILLDNRVRQGLVGYEVYTRFIDDQAQEYLINRGWIAAPPRRDLLPQILTDTNPVQIEGYLYRSKGKPFLLEGSKNMEAGWPLRVQSVDIEAMNHAFGWSLFPYEIRLSSDTEAGAFTTGWPILVMTPERHRGYAAQWFGLAFVLLVLSLVAHRKMLPSATGPAPDINIRTSVNNCGVSQHDPCHRFD